MSTGDSIANITGTDGTYPVQTAFFPSADGGGSGHFQLMGLAYDNGGNSWATASEAGGFPVRIPASSTVGNYIQDIYGCIGTAAGGSCMNVDIVSSAGLTVNAIVENLIVGITSTPSAFAQIGVYGTGGTAVGMTGSVYIINNDVYKSAGIAVLGTGGSSVGGDVGVTGQVKVDPTSTILVSGRTGVGSSIHSDIGVTGQVAVDSNSLIGISGGVTIASVPSIAVQMPSNGITSGGLIPGIMGVSFAARGLSSGIRITAFTTGSTANYVFVGGGTPYGLSQHGYPLREMDSIFLEIDDMKYVCVSSDNAAATIRYVAT